MFNLLLALVLIFSRVPLTGFQFLLLLCLIEIETGVLVGDYYCATILFFYLLYRYMWWSALRAPVAQRN